MFMGCLKLIFEKHEMLVIQINTTNRIVPLDYQRPKSVAFEDSAGNEASVIFKYIMFTLMHDQSNIKTRRVVSV